MPDHFMAQSSKTPLNIEVFWEKSSLEPPLEWSKWFVIFTAALFAKEDIDATTLTGTKPPSVTLPKRPRAETAVPEETADQKAQREVRNSISQTKWENECNKARAKGIMCGEMTWDRAERKSVNLLFLSIGTEGRKIFLRKQSGTINMETCSFKDMVKGCKDSFEKVRNLTFDRYLLFTRKQKPEETLEQFLCSLRELATYCQFRTLETTLIRDIFTAHLLDFEIQKELLKDTKSPADAIDLALRLELSFKNTRALNRTPSAAGGLNPTGSANAIQQKRSSGTRQPF